MHSFYGTPSQMFVYITSFNPCMPLSVPTLSSFLDNFQLRVFAMPEVFIPHSGKAILSPYLKGMKTKRVALNYLGDDIKIPQFPILQVV